MTYTTQHVAILALATATISVVARAQAPTGRASAPAPTDRTTLPTERTKGFILGVQTIAAPGISITGPDVDGEFKTNFGAGAGVMFGYGFSRLVSAYASLDLAKQQSGAPTYAGTFGLAHLEAGVRVNVPFGTSATLPYLSASYGRRAVGARITDTEQERDYDMTLSGKAFGIGGGIERFISSSMALDVGASANFGRFDKYDADGEQAPLDVSASRSLRMHVGVNWRPGRR